jgi:hypothetical protein
MPVQTDLRNTTDAVTTVSDLSRTTRRRLARRWTRPAAMAALVVAGLFGVYNLRDSSPTKTAPTTSGARPLVIAEEQRFIDRQHGRVPHAVSATVGRADWCATHRPC